MVDPGEDFLWYRDEMDEQVIHKLNITNQEKKALLNDYLDLVQVTNRLILFNKGGGGRASVFNLRFPISNFS